MTNELTLKPITADGKSCLEAVVRVEIPKLQHQKEVFVGKITSGHRLFYIRDEHLKGSDYQEDFSGEELEADYALLFRFRDNRRSEVAYHEITREQLLCYLRGVDWAVDQHVSEEIPVYNGFPQFERCSSYEKREQIDGRDKRIKPELEGAQFVDVTTYYNTGPLDQEDYESLRFPRLPGSSYASFVEWGIKFPDLKNESDNS